MADAAPSQVLFKPFPGFQEQVLMAREFDLFAGGAKGPGKTDLLVIKMLEQVHLEGFKGLLLRETFPELQEVIDRTHRYYSRLPMKPAWNGSEMRWRFPNDVFIECGYCAKPEDVERYQGREFSRIGFDELGNVRDERVVTTLQAEIRSRNPAVHRQFIGTGNPGKAGHAWIRRRYITPCGERGERVHWEGFVLPNGKRTFLSRRFIPGRVTDNPIYANDPLYLAQLMSLPDRQRRQLLYGEWDAATGMALEELSSRHHFVPQFTIPPHWRLIAGFDWGFAHNWVFTYAAITEDGTVFLLGTLKGRRMLDHDIAQAIIEGIGGENVLRRFDYIDAGHDCWHIVKARTDNTPATAERFADAGILLRKANIDRMLGLANLRHYLAWRGQGPDGRDALPRLRFMDTPGNRWLFEQLEGITLDPAKPNVHLKVDADSDTGVGGDDGYDTLRYMMAGRAFAPLSQHDGRPMSVFDPQVLRDEMERMRRHSSATRTEQFSRNEPYISTGEIG